MKRFRPGTPPTVLHGILLAVFLLAPLLLMGCGKSTEVVISVRDEDNKPVAGVRITQLDTNEELGTTDAVGRVTVNPERSGDDVMIGATPPDGAAGQYHFEKSYVLGDDAFKNGRSFIRAERGVGGDATTVTLRVTSEPRGATITVNGAVMGATNTVLTELPAGQITLVLSLEGVHPDTVDLFLDRGEEAVVHRDLSPAAVRTATLRVSSEPSGAAISLNGRRSEQLTPARFSDLEPGRYDVRINKAGYQEYRASVELRAGKEGAVDSGPLADRNPAPPARTETTRRSDPPARETTPPAQRETTPPAQREITESYSRRFTINTVPGWAEVYVDRDPVNRNQLGKFEMTLNQGTHLFRVVNDRAGVNVVLKYEVKRGDKNSILHLNYETKSVSARP